MKTEIQILHFLGQQTFKSESAWRLISSFCSNDLKYNLPINPKYSAQGIGADDFSEWFENGFASGDVAWLNNDLVMLGKCTLQSANIESTLSDGVLHNKRLQAAVTDLKHASEEDRVLFISELSKQQLQFVESSQSIAEKRIPRVNERVVFYNDKVRGLGVVREVRVEDNYIEFYCYYIYNSGKIGYSMHEKGVCTLHEYYFDAMSISSQRRVNRELGKYGKVWNDKMHRIEPLQVKLPKGEKYWYINDKFKVVQEVDKSTPTSNFRYLAGNYFVDYDDCLEYAGIISELMRDRLAKPEKPTEGH